MLLRSWHVLIAPLTMKLEGCQSPLWSMRRFRLSPSLRSKRWINITATLPRFGVPVALPVSPPVNNQKRPPYFGILCGFLLRVSACRFAMTQRMLTGEVFDILLLPTKFASYRTSLLDTAHWKVLHPPSCLAGHCPCPLPCKGLKFPALHFSPDGRHLRHGLELPDSF